MNKKVYVVVSDLQNFYNRHSVEVFNNLNNAMAAALSTYDIEGNNLKTKMIESPGDYGGEVFIIYEDDEDNMGDYWLAIYERVARDG